MILLCNVRARRHESGTEMSIKTLQTRTSRLAEKLTPRPTIIDCTGARETLIAELEASMTPEELAEPYIPTDEEQAEEEQLDALLEQLIKQTERQYNMMFL